MSDSDEEFFDSYSDFVPERTIHNDYVSNNTTQSAGPSSPPEMFTPIIEVTQDFSSFEYGMNNKYRGLAIIFNHLYFNESSGYTIRAGTEKDVIALRENLLYLGFQKDHIIVKDNLTKAQILNYVNSLIAEKDDILKNSDCLAIFILSHGSENNRLVASDNIYDLYDLVEQYTSNNLKQLAGKPKLFFVQACRGKKNDGGAKFQTTSSDSRSDWCDGGRYIRNLQPSMADILISHSSYHGYASFLNDSGSWYVQDFCNAIREFSTEGLLETTDITDILTYTTFLTSQRDAQRGNVEDKKQCPTFKSGLSRKLYFKKNKAFL